MCEKPLARHSYQTRLVLLLWKKNHTRTPFYNKLPTMLPTSMLHLYSVNCNDSIQLIVQSKDLLNNQPANMSFRCRPWDCVERFTSYERSALTCKLNKRLTLTQQWSYMSREPVNMGIILLSLSKIAVRCNAMHIHALISHPSTHGQNAQKHKVHSVHSNPPARYRQSRSSWLSVACQPPNPWYRSCLLSIQQRMG